MTEAHNIIAKTLTQIQIKTQNIKIQVTKL